MKISIRLTVLILSVAALAGCASSGDRVAAPERALASVTERTTVRMPRGAEQACLRDVALEAGNPDVLTLVSTPSPEGTEVIVGVGPQRERWRCIGYDDGTTTVVIAIAVEERL